jgi:hypothetical protein
MKKIKPDEINSKKPLIIIKSSTLSGVATHFTHKFFSENLFFLKQLFFKKE